MKVGKLLITLRRRCPSCHSGRRIWKHWHHDYTCRLCGRDFSGGKVVNIIRYAWRTRLAWISWPPAAEEVAATNGHHPVPVDLT